MMFFGVKLRSDFFNRRDIRVIESMPDGKEYLLFYLKLLCEAVDHDGKLRFSEVIPYNEQMLSVVMNTNIDIVTGAMKVLSDYGLLSILADGTIVVRRVKNGARDRNSKEYKEWRKAVFERDKYTCQLCKAKGVKLNAHHKKPWSKFPQLRYDPENGITLCEKCHKAYHKKNGRG